MSMFGLINIGVLPLLLEAMTPGYAQHEREAKHPAPEHQSEPEHQARQGNPSSRQPQPRQREAQERQRERPDNQSPQARPYRQERQSRGDEERSRPRPMPRQAPDRRSAEGRAQRREGQHRTIWQQHRAGNWQAEHRTWQDRGGYQGYRIPTDRYRRHFGPQFGFRMYSFPLVVVGGFPRFQYQGFWFSVLDPWPEYWSGNWYGEDDLFIEYSDDGYYLYNRMHPTDRIAISVRIR